ncbi:hypothetical protein BTO30_14010 [Domibacillus antri]|uniref:Stage 0 sporulation protein M n=1 Tax=Domibacillus antri TaxID=1714264 RepID=A0A1Q8Q2L8_9BACI|nr:sporulation protein [Domibacillus antri]OLN21593.1 hypothetical protein BTO30_14010 [Domibacillus antri]
MWKEFFSSIGLDSVKVDTVIHDKHAEPRDTIKGEVRIQGGLADEIIDKIIVLLYLQYEEVHEDSDFSWHDKHIEEVTIDVKRNIKSGEQDQVPFTIMIPQNAEKTDEKHKWYLKTTVVIPAAVDPTDEDEIMIV